jgi:mRNA interferase RelE/StbE
MPRYSVELRPSAAKALRKIDPAYRPPVPAPLQGFADDPRPPHATALKGHRPWLRVRAGDYRLIYDVDDIARKVTVAVIGHRREVYRNLSF